MCDLCFFYQEFKWCQLSVFDQPQVLSHDMQYTTDSSSEVWDVKKEAFLQKWGIQSTKFEVHSGQTIVLPTRRVHVFKKIGNLRTTTRTVPVPILGYAGDCSFIESSNESFTKNWLYIKVCTFAIYTFNFV
jgi:hypothetical protein